MSSGQQVLIKLRKMIIAGELEGGSRIAEIPTAEMLGVSRQPVRMAFRLLEQEGLLIKNPTRGYIVREISDDLIRDALQVRGVLEGLAAKTLAEKGITEEQKKTYDGLMVKVTELEEAGKYREACSKLPDPTLFPNQQEAITKKREELVQKFSTPTLFEPVNA